MNFGHGELGFGAWPSAKSAPVAEYCTVFRVSAPIAFAALLMTVLASCAEAVHTSIVASARPARHFLSMFVFLSVFRYGVARGYCKGAVSRASTQARREHISGWPLQGTGITMSPGMVADK